MLMDKNLTLTYSLANESRAPLAVFDSDVSSSTSSPLKKNDLIPIPTHRYAKNRQHLVECVDETSFNEIEDADSISAKSTKDTLNLRVKYYVLIAAFFINFIQEGLQYSVSVLYKPIITDFNSTKAQAAWITSAFLAMPHLGAPMASGLINRFGCRGMAILGAVLVSTGVGLSSLTINLLMLFFTYGIIAGFGISLFDIASNTILSQYFDDKLSFVSGIAVGGGGLGLLVLMPITDLFLEKYGWRYTYITSAGLYSLIIFFGVLLRPPNNEETICLSVNNVNNTEFNNPQNKKTQKRFIQRLSDFFKNTLVDVFEPFYYRSFILFAVSNFILYFFYDLPYVYMPNELIKISWLISIMGVLNIIGQIFLGWLGDKKNINPQIVYALSMILSGITVVIMPFMNTPYSISLTAGFYGLFISGNYALTNIIIKGQILPYLSFHKRGLLQKKQLDEKFTNSYGLLAFIQGISNFVGLPLIAWFLDVYESPDLIFYIAGAAIVFSGLIMICLPAHDYFIRKPNNITIVNVCKTNK